MWKKIVIIIACVLLAAGIGLILFPIISNEIGKTRANDAIEAFVKRSENAVEEYLPPYIKEAAENGDEEAKQAKPAKSRSEAIELGYIDKNGFPLSAKGNRLGGAPIVFKYDLEMLHTDSIEYNHGLINNQGTVDTSDYTTAALDMSKYGLSNFYCYLTAPEIGMRLPVYLGANEDVMSYGAAHLCNTSLPLDEKSTNCAIAAHTGYIGRIFFDNIKGLGKGDVITVNNYWESIDYEVIETKTISPNDTSDIYIKEGRQLLTLITCTTDNVVTNRYVVIAEKK